MTWVAKMPANIALIKYMGKKNGQQPTNASLSYTSDTYFTEVTLEISNTNQFDQPELNPSRFLAHLERLQKHFDVTECFKITSKNFFPGSCGMASSASSFAALTECFSKFVEELYPDKAPSVTEKANLSRLGSGSSCRSFFGPFAIWDHEGVRAIDLPYKELKHSVIVVDPYEKKISSSSAHLRIESSLLNVGRPQRAEKRLKDLIQALQNKDWHKSFEICWQEFWDMHTLFHTSSPPFHYLTPSSLEVLMDLHSKWEKNGYGPLITVDAGPNIHLLSLE